MLQDSDQSSQHSGVSLQYPENTTTPENIMSPPSTTPEDRPQSRSSSQSTVTSRRRKRVPREEPINDALDRLQNITSAINTHTEYDEFHYFGLNLAAQLRSLPLYDALDLQTQIQNILITARRRHMGLNLSPVTESTLINTPYTQTITTSSALSAPPQTGTQFYTLPNIDLLHQAWQSS